MPTLVITTEDAGPTTQDARVFRTSAAAGEIFSVLRSGAGTFAQGVLETGVVEIRSGTATDRYDQLIRVLLLFDTSSIPNLAQVTSAKITMSIIGKTNFLFGENNENSRMIVTASNPASNTSVILADYGAFSDLEFGRSAKQADLTAGADNDLPFNANGLAAIAIGVGAVSKFGLRYLWDVSDTVSGLVWSVTSTQNISFTHNITGINKPTLTVNFDLAVDNLAVVSSDCSNSLDLSWTRNTNSSVTSVRVERATAGGGPFTEIASLAPSATSFSDDIALSSTERFYRVRSHDSATGLFSDFTSVQSAITAPAQPTGGGAVVDSPTQITFSWTDASSDEDFFEVERKEEPAGVFAQVGTPAASPFVDTTVVAGRKYTYRVRAHRNSDDINSCFSFPVNVASTSSSAFNLRALPNSDATGNVEVTVLWDTFDLRDQGYKIERSTDDVIFVLITTTAPGATFFLDTDPVLTPDATFFYRIITVGPDGDTLPTASVSVLTSIKTASGLEHEFLKKIGNFPRE